MTEIETKQRAKLMQQLVLGATDMKQAAAAAREIQRRFRLTADDTGDAQTEHTNLIRALETGMAVCYWRPFSKKNEIGALPKRWAPPDKVLHRELRDFRNKVYAHTDVDPRRSGGASGGVDDTGVGGFALEEYSVGFPPDKLDAVIALCESQAQRFTEEALRAAKLKYTAS